MKKLKTLLYGLFAAAMITGCSDETINNNDPGNTPGNGNNGDGVFMALDIEMPNGKYNFSRSETEDNQYGEGVSSGGIEIGKDYENTVSSALIILAAPEQIGDMPEYGFITAAQVRSNRIADLTTIADSKEYRAIAGVQKEYLESYYNLYAQNGLLDENATEGPKVNVFVFCNPPTDLIDEIDEGELYGTTEWMDLTCQVLQDQPGIPNRNVGIWGANSFLMNNVSVATRALPAKITDWEYYNSVESPFRLSDNNKDCGVDNSIETRGAVKVERSVARFDFRDGSNTDDNPKEDNTYNVLYLSNKNGEKLFPIVKVQLTKMCLVNMSNRFYYLPRVSSRGLGKDDKDYKILGRQKPWIPTLNGAELSYTDGNYVVGPYAQYFTADAYDESDDTSPSGVDKDFTRFFNYPFFENDGNFNNNEATWDRWYVSNISDVLLNGQRDNYNGSQNTEGGTYNGDYRIWRYVTENVIPAPRRSQKNGISTGVVFKARLKGTEDALTKNIETEEEWNAGFVKNIANCLNGDPFTYQGRPNQSLNGSSKTDPILYYFNGNLYMGWRHIRQAAIQAAVSFPDGYDKTPVINRSNSLYKAVFGDGPIPAGNKYMTDAKNGVDIDDPEWKSDETDWTNSAAYKNYLASADYAWTTWMGHREYESIDEDPLNPSADLIKMRRTISGQGITIYESSIDEDGDVGYYCYYYYWNRHNDNGKNGTMGPMEFDVVRNNVYKLSVDKINRLGHPRIPDNDPDSPTPDTPDESEQLYLAVKVQIVPWAVRVNSIVF